jgi:hypothetical protein
MQASDRQLRMLSAASAVPAHIPQRARLASASRQACCYLRPAVSAEASDLLLEYLVLLH